jgi:predicted RND superfamily exporter protein
VTQPEDSSEKSPIEGGNYTVSEVIANKANANWLKVNRYGRIVRRKAISSIKNFDIGAAATGVANLPKNIKRDIDRIGVIGMLTRFPMATVTFFLLITVYLTLYSGFVDINEKAPMPWQYKTENSLNVNGDLEVYLPDDDDPNSIKNQILEVKKDWSTNVMIIYVELGQGRNITDEEILHQFDKVEKELNPLLSDSSDNYIYALSLSTVIKEVNSSAPRVTKAVSTELGALFPGDIGNDMADYFNELVDDAEILGEYSIPSQATIDQIVGQLYEKEDCDEDDEDCDENNGKEVPSPALDKLARDSDGDGNLDKAVIIVAVDERLKAKDIIKNATITLTNLSENNNWNEIGLKMTLTGPVPITNAVTEYSFVLFWKVFPLGIILVAGCLFIFHCDFIHTFRMRKQNIVQGIKVVIISGLPTLCSVFWTLGIIGWTGYEVTMTVIIVGPILLALGVSYGLHITNRYAEEEGTPDEKMKKALQSTGKAVMLSAITTVIGFISLAFTPMAPIKTVGYALAGGIIIVYILTMAMVPNLTMILDLKKPKHPPLKPFVHLVNIPIKRNYLVIIIFTMLLLSSFTLGRENVEENIDLLGMAPAEEPAVTTMKNYSEDFNAGQIGMLMVDGAIKGDRSDDEIRNDDPVSNLQSIEALTGDVNRLENTTAVSIVFLMKAVGVSPTVGGNSIWEEIEDSEWCTGTCRDIAEEIVNQEVDGRVTFWDVLVALDSQPDAQIFLLNVFYSSITDETRFLFTSSDYERSLIYVDMPFIEMKKTASTVSNINEFAEEAPGDIKSTNLIGVAAVSIAVNELIVESQWGSLGYAIGLTIVTLAVVFRDLRYAIWTTLPVMATVFLQWLVMWQMDVSLSLVTVMVGSILVGVGVDFSIHISNRIKEMGGGIEAIRSSCVSTGMSLFEAAMVTTAGLAAAYTIPIPELIPFVKVVILLLWIAAASALILLPAIFVTLEKTGIGTLGGSTALARKIGLGSKSKEMLDADLIIKNKSKQDAW